MDLYLLMNYLEYLINLANCIQKGKISLTNIQFRVHYKLRNCIFMRLQVQRMTMKSAQHSFYSPVKDMVLMHLFPLFMFAPNLSRRK